MPTPSTHTALVTGASGGIGADIARALAARGVRLVIAARKADRLEALATELRERHHVEVHVFPADLSTTAGTAELASGIDAAGLTIDILVNNAGLGAWGQFAESTWHDAEYLMDLNMKSVVQLTAHFLPAMRARGFGHIMNVSSFVAFVSCPNFALYGASKAFVRNFSEALDHELRGSGVRSIAVCPGGTRTGFSDAAGQKLSRLGERSLMPSDVVAKKSVAAMFRGRRTYIPGFPNALMAWLIQRFPRAWRPGIIGRAMAAGIQKGPGN
jgi:short-subunit dehydrogenase